MARYESWFVQDLTKPVQIQYINGNLFSEDVQGNRIGVEVLDNGATASISGTVFANIIRPDGGTVVVTGTLDGNKASVILPAAAYAYPGNAAIIIKLTTGSVVTTLLAVIVTIYRTSTDVAVDPGTVMPNISTLISAIENAIESIPADYSMLSGAVTDGIQRVVPRILWKNGYYNSGTGAYTSSDSYRCTTGSYPKDLFPFLTGWLFRGLDYVCLYNGDTYVGYYNTAQPGTLTSLTWDNFRLVVYEADRPASYTTIRFVTLGNVDSIQQSDVLNVNEPVVWWQTGIYKTQDGTYDKTVGSYVCSVQAYKKEHLSSIRGWDFGSSLCYITLYNENTYVTYKNAGADIPLTGWDRFRMTVYLQAVNNDVSHIHFSTLPTVDGIISNALRHESHEIQWKSGYYDPTTGVYTDSPRYKCTTHVYEREKLKYLTGWDFSTGSNYIALFNNGNFVRAVNNGDASGLARDDWNAFVLVVFDQNTTPVSLREIRFQSLLNNHIEIEVSSASELISAVERARIDEEKDNYYDIYLRPGTYELWSALDRSQISGTGDQLYHRGLELPDKCNLYGIGTVVLSCTIPESDNSEEHPYTLIVSTLNMHNTENIIENINIVGNNTRYCIHDDSGFDDNYKLLVMRNCRFTHNGTASDTYMPSPRCYGAGFTTGRKAIFENCIFESSGNCSYQFYVHTHSAENNKADISTLVQSCAFISANKTAVDYQVTKSDVPGGVLTVRDCVFASGNRFLIRGVPSETINNPSAKIFISGSSPVEITNQVNATIYNAQDVSEFTMGAGTSDEVTVTAAQMKQLLALL